MVDKQLLSSATTVKNAGKRQKGMLYSKECFYFLIKCINKHKHTQTDTKRDVQHKIRNTKRDIQHNIYVVNLIQHKLS